MNLPRAILSEFIVILVPRKVMKCDLDTFQGNFLAKVILLSNSEFKIEIAVSMLLVKKMHTLSRSLIYKINKSRPSTDLWENPYVIHLV